MQRGLERTFEIQELLNESGWLRALARSLVADPAQADDLVQDTWLAALRHPPRADRDARPWLARVARNLVRNERRLRLRRAEREELVHEEPEPPTPAGLAQVAEAQRLLAEAVTRLPEGQRAVIVLCYFQGLDSGEAGARLGISASAVRTRLQAALAALRVDLDRRSGGREAWAGLLAGLARAGEHGARSAAASGGAWLGSWSLALASGAAALGLTVLLVQRGSDAGARVDLAESSELPGGGAASPSPAEARLRPGAREALPPGPAATSGASPAAGARTTRISGTIRVDGREPDWPLELLLVPTPPPGSNVPFVREQRRELALRPEQRGAFAFEDVPESWSGTLSVEHHALASGARGLELSAPRTDLVLELRADPAIVGLLLDPEGQPCRRLVGTYELQIGRTDEEAHDTTAAGFACRGDGRFRIPYLARCDWGAVTLRVEAAGVGFLHRESPRFAPEAGLDLGELQLEALHPLAFHVRDTRGTPLEGATALVEGFDWASDSEPTDAEGRGVLAFAPDRAVAVRFGAPGHADRIVTVDGGEELEVELERLAILDIRLTGAGRERVRTVVLASEQPVFVWDASDWSARPGETHERIAARDRRPAESTVAVRARAEPGSSIPSVRRRPVLPGQRYEYEFTPGRAGRVPLIGLVADVVVALEVRDAEGHVLAASTFAATAEEWAELELSLP